MGITAEQHEYLENIGMAAKEASRAKLSANERSRVLIESAAALRESSHKIITANKEDLQAAEEAGMKKSFIDRLMLNEARIESMAEGLEAVAALPDPLADTVNTRTLANGLIIGQRSVPFGVICMIYEARPNVTVDAYGLCFKAGSACVLRGGKEALGSNTALVAALHSVLEKNGLPAGMVQLITDTSRDVSLALMKMNGYIDLLIPRGGGGLIKSVVENSTVPVIETGVGNCHIFVDETAELEKAVAIVVNAKAQRPGVCNACEKLLVHEKIAVSFLPAVCAELKKHGVEIRGDEKTANIVDGVIPAKESDWPLEYEDYIIAVKVVEGIDEALAHIQKYSTSHSEAIITENYTNAQRFLDDVDSAAVYVNASTRFTDGFCFGLGAEIGISTQKLHARGPMGLKELTSTKYVIYGNGQIRE